MAQYIFVKYRKEVKSNLIHKKLKSICELLTPAELKGNSQNTINTWSDSANSFYAIQNSEGVTQQNQHGLLIGMLSEPASGPYCSNADGSYAIIQNSATNISFFSDQFGSRTLWYFLDDEKLIVSTSQRAIVAFKSVFHLNETAIAWYLSSGCQGPFISWDVDIKQVKPDMEYDLKVTDWTLDHKIKLDRDLPLSGSSNEESFLQIYQEKVASTLNQIIEEHPKQQVLLPLSGGLDSRLLFSLSKDACLEDELTLVNWGVKNNNYIFDDKVASNQVAKFYEKEMLNVYLPNEISDPDETLQIFVENNEGRIDHFNAFADSFKMWSEFFTNGYRVIIRGDIPYTEGVDINVVQARAHIGLDLFTDYANTHEFKLNRYVNLQREYDISRLDGESLVRWRDRLYINWRIPMVVSSFSDQISAYTENRSPMMNWSLFKLYMGLPDREKGNKPHIEKLWNKLDKSGVSSHAVGSLRSMNSYFESELNKDYLLSKLEFLKSKSSLCSDMIDSIYTALLNEGAAKESNPTILKVKSWLSHNLPNKVKAHLKSKQSKKLSAVTLAYRIILCEKIIKMYTTDAEYIEDNNVS